MLAYNGWKRVNGLEEKEKEYPSKESQKRLREMFPDGRDAVEYAKSKRHSHKT